MLFRSKDIESSVRIVLSPRIVTVAFEDFLCSPFPFLKGALITGYLVIPALIGVL